MIQYSKIKFKLKPFTYFKKVLLKYSSSSVFCIRKNSEIPILYLCHEKKLENLSCEKTKYKAMDCGFENNLLPVPERFKMKASSIPC